MDVLDTTNSGNRTLAAVLYEASQPLRLTALGIPELKPGQVLVDIAYSGVCHSQLNEVFGRKGPDPYLPHALGHEGSGTVVAVGSAVTKVQAGDAVVLTWIKGEGADVPGTVYASADGPVNSGAISTFMRRAVVSENRLVPLPAGMPMREAALLGCAIPTGAGIVLNTGEVGAGASVAVFGAGGIGIGAVMAAVAAGAEAAVAVDVNTARLADAAAAGATHTVDAGSEDAAAAVMALTGGAASTSPSRRRGGPRPWRRLSRRRGAAAASACSPATWNTAGASPSTPSS